MLTKKKKKGEPRMYAGSGSPYTTGASFKTGGMVNSNTKVSADKSAGSKGVKSGVNAKASASKKAKGKVGGTSKAPKKANP